MGLGVYLLGAELVRGCHGLLCCKGPEGDERGGRGC